MPKHALQSLILRPLSARTMSKFALCITLFSGAGALSGCGQKGDLRPVTPKPPAQIIVAVTATINY